MVGGYIMLDMSFADGANSTANAVKVPKSIQKKIERMSILPIGSSNGVADDNARQKPIYVKWKYNNLTYINIGFLYTQYLMGPQLFTETFIGSLQKRTYYFTVDGDDLKVYYVQTLDN